MDVQCKLPVPSSFAVLCFPGLIFEALIPFQTHLKSTTNNVTVAAAATTLPQTSEASSSTQQTSVSSPPQEQPAATQKQELSSIDTMARPGPSDVRTYQLSAYTCISLHLQPILITFSLVHFTGAYS